MCLTGYVVSQRARQRSTSLVFHLNACVYIGVEIRIQIITLDSRLEFKADFLIGILNYKCYLYASVAKFKVISESCRLQDTELFRHRLRVGRL